MSNYPEGWSEEKIKEWETDLELISGIMGLFCHLSSDGKWRMCYIIKITIEGLDEGKKEDEQSEAN